MNQISDTVPPGWKRYEHKGRIVYSTPPPISKQIWSRGQLTELHDKGLFRDVSTEQLIFSKKRKIREYNYGEETIKEDQEIVTARGVKEFRLIR